MVPFILASMSGGDLAELISEMAHELRSPLTSIKGFSSTLVSRWASLPDEQRYQFVDMIHTDADRMSRMVSEIVDLARLEVGRLPLNRTEASIRQIVDKAVDNLVDTERVTVDVKDELTAWTDAARLTDVMATVVASALELSDHGSVEVGAGLSGGRVELRVVAVGARVAADALAHLFEPPSPERARRTAASGGGLRLYLMRRLVEAQGGSIKVVAGEDAAFVVSLPTGTRP